VGSGSSLLWSPLLFSGCCRSLAAPRASLWGLESAVSYAVVAVPAAGPDRLVAVRPSWQEAELLASSMNREDDDHDYRVCAAAPAMRATLADTTAYLLSLGFVPVTDHTFMSPGSDETGRFEITAYKCSLGYYCVRIDGGYSAPIVWDGVRQPELIEWLDTYHKGWNVVVSSPFCVLRFDSLASFEAALSAAQLWQAGPEGGRVILPPALLDGVSRVLIGDVVGESPFQSWGGEFELRLFVDSLPSADGVAPYPLFAGDGFSQLIPCVGDAPELFVFNVLVSA